MSNVIFGALYRYNSMKETVLAFRTFEDARPTNKPFAPRPGSSTSSGSSFYLSVKRDFFTIISEESKASGDTRLFKILTSKGIFWAFFEPKKLLRIFGNKDQ